MVLDFISILVFLLNVLHKYLCVSKSLKLLYISLNSDRNSNYVFLNAVECCALLGLTVANFYYRTSDLFFNILVL